MKLALLIQWRRSARTVLAVAATIALIAGLSGAARAATITVSSAADGAAIAQSLRAAVVQANTSGGSNTIVFAAALAGATISLNTVGDGTYGPSALPVTSTIVIDGSAAPGLTIARDAAAANMRLFYVAPVGNLTLRNLTLSGGVAKGGNGGNAHNGGMGGGAAGFGGAVYNRGVLTIQSSNLQNHQALGGAGGSLGGPNLSFAGGAGGGGMGGTGGDAASDTGASGGGPNAGGGGAYHIFPGGTGGSGGLGGGGGGGGFSAGPGGAAEFGGGGGGGGVSCYGPAGASARGGPGGFGGGGGGGASYPCGGWGGPGNPGGFGGGMGSGGGNGPDGAGPGGGGAGMGGAVFNDGGTVTLTSATLSNNAATGGNGGSNQYRGSADGGSGYGGAVFNLDGSVIQTGTTFTGNTVTAGAGSSQVGPGSALGNDVFEKFNFDYGDAPAPYPTLRADNGARHFIQGPRLGIIVPDGEADGQPSVGANADENSGTADDNDGVVFMNPVVATAGYVVNLQVTTTGGGLLDAWVDFNLDGNWNGANEKIFSSRALNNGVNNLSFTMPAGVVAGNSYARFRLSTAGGLAPTGAAADGEVEDYRVTILPAALPTALVVDALQDLSNGNLSPGDLSLREALQIANLNPATTTITFSPALSGATITLKAIGDGTYGPSALVVNRAIVIDGSAATGLTIARDGSAPDMRLFYVTSAGNLTLRNVTVRGGRASGFGGAAAASGGSGGGSAGLGGGLFNRGTLTIEGATFNDNQAKGGPGGSAGTNLSRYGNGGGGLGGPGNYGLTEAGNELISGNGGGPNGGIGPGNPNDPYLTNTGHYPINEPGGNGGIGGGGAGGFWGGVGGSGGFGGAGGGGGGGCYTGGTGGLGGFGGGGGGGGGWDCGGDDRSYPGGAGGFAGGAGGHGGTCCDHGGGGGGGSALGGAVFNDAGSVAVASSTFSGNAAKGGGGGNGAQGGSAFGGAIFNRDGAVTILNSTFAGNSVAAGTGGAPLALGGGVYNRTQSGAATLSLQNTIVADSVGGDDAHNDGGTVTGDHNLIESSGGLPAGIVSLTSDPLLGPLQGNGGPTFTRALSTGSPAINAAAASTATTDQRGLPRPSGLGPDIGAFEVQGPGMTPTTLPSGIVGVAYGQSVTPTGGAGPFTFALAAGTLPPGLTFTAAGLLSGTPTAIGIYHFTLQVTDASNASGQRTYVVVIAPQGSVAYCSNPNLAITDNAPAGVADTLTVPAGGTIADLNVVVAAAHPWIGDLILKLTHVNTGTVVTLLDRPGVPASGTGCSGDDLAYVTFDDEGTLNAETACTSGASGVQAYPAGAALIPNTPLSAFDGQSLAGDWRLTASDNGGGNTGTLNAWCVVSQNLVTTALASSANPSTFGQNVTFTATVSGVTSTGMVNFRDGASTITGCGAVALAGGQAQCATNSLSATTHAITAVYSGDVNNVGNTSGTLNQVVNKVVSTTVLGSSANPSAFGQSVTFAATIAGQAPGGTVNFKDGAASITGCSAVVVAASAAQCTTNALTVASHSMTAVYSGDANNATSTSNAISQSVTGQPDLIVQSITPVPPGPVVGQPVGYTVRIKNQGPVAAASGFYVDFYVDHAPTGCQDFNSVNYWTQGPLAAGATADLTFTYSGFTGAGAHQLYAFVDSGCQIAESNDGNNTLGPQSITVGKAATALTIVSDLNPASFGQTVTLSATLTVTAPGSGSPTGTVAFKDGGVDLVGCAAVPVAGGQAACAATGLSAATHSMTAVYGGDGNNNGSTSSVLSEVVSPPTTMNPLASGEVHTCALRSTGVACWGYNGFGQLGDNTQIDRATPVAANGMGTGVTWMAAGGSHTCALTAGSGVKCWGWNGSGQLGNGTTNMSLTPVDVTGLTGTVKAITSGSGHLCALTNAGAVLCWGSNANGQLGDNSTTNHTVPTAVSGLGSGVIAIAAGASHTCALNTGGGVLCWGLNDNGRLGDNTTTQRLVPTAVSGLASGATGLTAGDSHTCAVISGGTAKCWGSNSAGRLGDGTNADRWTPVVVSGLTGVTQIGGGHYHTCAMVTGGGIKCWGYNGFGQVGDGTFADQWLPVPVNGFASGAQAMTVGGLHTCALTSVGGVKCWGDNRYGELGDGTFTQHSAPAFVSNLNIVGGPALVSAANPSSFGQSVTFTATVTGATPTGTVNFRDGASSLAGCAAVALTAGGQASCPTAALAGGIHSITAQYGGDANNPGATSVALNQSVVKATATSGLGSSGSPSKFGQSVTFTATITGSAPTGTVTFNDGAHALCTGVVLAGGQAACGANGFTVGSHGITAVYSGDGNNFGGTSAVLSQVVNAAGTATTLSLPVNPSKFGQAVQLTATVAAVAPGAGTPTGTVTFKDGGTPVCGATLSGGAAQCGIASFASGGHSITVDYSGDANFASGTSSAQTQTVNSAATTTALVSGINPSVFGQAVQFTATAAVVAPGAGTPTGTITMNEGATPLCSALAFAGQAACAASALAVGSHGIQAAYPGDANFSTSTSATLTQVVNKAGTATAINAHTPEPSPVGSPITIGASVAASAPGAGVPGGVITVSDGASTCQITLPAASCNLVPASVGAKTLTAVYSGDGSFNGSTSAGMPHAVNTVATTNLLSSLNNPGEFGQGVTFIASVTGLSPSGTVNFKEGATSLGGCGAVTVASGQAQCALSILSVGTHGITAEYSGDSRNAASTASVVNQVINMATTTTTLGTSPNPSAFNQSVTFTATITGQSPTGTVSFRNGGTSLPGCNAVTVVAGQAQCALGTLGVASHSITAVYSGDGNNAASAANAVDQLVNKATTTVTLGSSPSPSTFGQSVSFTATIGGQGPTGTVNFTEGATSLTSCGAVAVAAGQAVCTLSGLNVGTHSIAAAYSGDSNNAASTASAISQAVNAGGSSVTLSATGPIHRGQQSTVNAVVSAAGGMPTGAVAVTGAGGSCTITLAGGAGNCLLLPTIVGANQALTGNYAGDAGNGASTGMAQLTVTSAFDIDGNDASDALTDGLLAIRHLFGLTGNALIAGAVGPGAQLTDPAAIADYMAKAGLLLDIDGDGHADALTDGLLLIRYLFGLRGAALIQGAVATGATRTTAAAIEAYIAGLIQ